MNLSSLSAVSTFSPSTDVFYTPRSVPSTHVTRMTWPSVHAEAGHGCLVLEQTLDPENVPQDIISAQTHLWISTISSAGLTPLLFVVGVPGNILSAAVVFKQGLKERINFCIFSLALVDAVVITSVFFVLAENVYRVFFGSSNIFIKYFVGASEFNKVSMFLSTVIAAERCFCVVSPLRAQRMLSTRTLAVVVVTMSIIILTGMVVIAGPKHTEACVFDPATNRTSFIMFVTEYYIKNQTIFDLIDIFVYSMALPLLCFGVIVVTTIITAVNLRSAVSWRQQSTSTCGGQSSEHATSQMVAVTRMLIGTSVLFVVCFSPILVVQMAVFLVPQLKRGGPYNNAVDVLFTLVNFFRCVNSSCNFFVYYYMGSRFRQTLKQLLSCERCERPMKKSVA